ncbi:MAG: hypothetical protein HAW67_05050 [Endozoicomonadaceae bacterium]|nr:hypothetical protein [Endozoicomonadaceae bacterium]
MDEMVKNELIASPEGKPYVLFKNINFDEFLDEFSKAKKDSFNPVDIERIKLLISYLASNQKEKYFYSLKVLAEELSVGLITLRRLLDKAFSEKLVVRHSLKALNSGNFITWEFKSINEANRINLPTTSLPKSSSKSHISDNEKDLLRWSEGHDSLQELYLIFGHLIFSVFSTMFLSKKQFNDSDAPKIIEDNVKINGAIVPVEMTCSVNSELPIKDDLLRYFSLLECVANSMRESLLRNPTVELDRSSYEVPLNKINEQLGLSEGGVNRKGTLASLDRLQAKIKILELPDSDILNGKESFINFSPIANLQVYTSNILDGIKVTGAGTKTVVFSLPTLVINSLISYVTGNKGNVQNKGEGRLEFLEEMFSIPSMLVKGRYSLFTEVLFMVRTKDQKNEDGHYFLTLSEIIRELKLPLKPANLFQRLSKAMILAGGIQINKNQYEVITNEVSKAVITRDLISIHTSKN